MLMGRTKRYINTTVSHEIVERLDAWRGRQKFPPDRNAILEDALDEWLKKAERKERAARKQEDGDG